MADVLVIDDYIMEIGDTIHVFTVDNTAGRRGVLTEIDGNYFTIDVVDEENQCIPYMVSRKEVTGGFRCAKYSV